MSVNVYLEGEKPKPTRIKLSRGSDIRENGWLIITVEDGVGGFWTTIADDEEVVLVVEEQ